MLELIVLGEVPGTDIIITFAWAAALLALFSGSICMMLLRRITLATPQSPRLIEEITL